MHEGFYGHFFFLDKNYGLSNLDIFSVVTGTTGTGYSRFVESRV